MQKEKIIQELQELKNDNRFRTVKTNDKSLYNFSKALTSKCLYLKIFALELIQPS